MESSAIRWLALSACFVFGSVLQAQDTPHPARGLVLESIPWISDGAEFLDKKRFKTSMTKEEAAMDREKLLDEALAQARRTQRPVLWYVYKIVEKSKRGRQMIRAPVLDVYMRQVVWSDPDVERIVTNSFVPLRTVFDEAMCKRFDLRPLTFLEPAALFLSPEGKVLHVLRTIRTFDAPWIAGVLRDVLEKAHGPLDSDAFDTTLDRGEWKRALAILDRRASATARDAYRRATMLRRLRRGTDALDALATARARLTKEAEVLAAKAAGTSETGRRSTRRRRRRGRQLPAELQQLDLLIEAETGALMIAMGKFDAAVAPLRKVSDARVASSAQGSGRRAEARYRLALLRLRAGDESGAIRRFQKIVQDDPGDLYARRADVNLRVGIDDGLSLGAPMFGYERLAWLPAEAYTKLPEDTRWPGKPLTDAQLIDNCVRAVLAQQRADGGWNDSRYAYCPDARITPNVWVAISAICCQALLRQRDKFADKELIDAALRRGEAFLLDNSRLNRGRNEDVYADTYRLLFLAHRWQTDPDTGRRGKRHAAMTRIVNEARDRQKSAGFWAHEYSNAFCTAAMVQGLLAAKHVGVIIPDEMLSLARSALLSARREDGSFSYGGAARSKKPRKGSLKNASTRTPMCEGALRALDGSSDERLRFAFDNFWDNYSTIEGVRRTDFHSDGQVAGFMFMHALYHTSEAIALLAPKRARRERAKLRAKLREYPEIDGTFLDSEELGRSYGTAMALLILANTEKQDGGGR